MLKMMRKSATSGITKFIIFGLLMAGALGLALTGGYGFFRDGVQHANSVASIGHVNLDADNFNSLVRRQLGQQGVSPQEAYKAGYINQMLDQQIDGNLLARASSDLGLKVSDDMVRDQVRKVIAPFITSGMTAKDALSTILRNQGMTEAGFIEEVRAQIADTLLRDALQDGTAVMNVSETTDLALYQNEIRSLETVFLPDTAVKDYKAPTDAVLKPFYQSGQERYAQPETRSFTLGVLSAKSVTDQATVSDDDLRKTYDEQKQSFLQPERRTLDQAILADEKQAQAVAAGVNKGKKLKDAVHDVTGSDKAYTGSQSYQRDGMDKKLGDATFGAKKGDVVGPVQTPLGWHVMKVEDILPPSQQSFEAVREKLRADAVAQKATDSLYNTSTQLDDQLAGGGTLDAAAKNFHLDLAKIGPVHADGSTPDKHDGMGDFAKDNAVVLKTAFGLSEGETSPVVSLSNGRYAAIRLDKVTPKSYTPFEQVRDDLGKLWIADQQNVLNKQYATDALSKLKSGAVTLDKIAQVKDAPVKKFDLARIAKPAEPMTDATKTAVFGTGVNQYFAESVKGGFMIGKVAAIKLPKRDTLPVDQIKTILNASTASMQNDILQAYLQNLRARYKVTVHQDTLQALYGKADSQPGDGGDNPNDQ